MDEDDELIIHNENTSKNGQFHAYSCSINWSISSQTCYLTIPWRRHQMETFSALLAICAGNSPVPGEFPTQRPVTRSFNVFFDLHLNKRLSKQSCAWWFEMLSHPLWRHRNAVKAFEHGTGHLCWTEWFQWVIYMRFSKNAKRKKNKNKNKTPWSNNMFSITQNDGLTHSHKQAP